MKRVIALLLVAILAFSLAACNMGKDKNNSTNNPPANSQNSNNTTDKNNQNSNNSANNNNNNNTKNTENILESMIPDISTNVNTEGQR